MKSTSALQRRIKALGRKLGSLSAYEHLAGLASDGLLFDVWFVIPLDDDDGDGAGVISDIGDRLRHFAAKPRRGSALSSVLFATSSGVKFKPGASLQNQINLLSEELAGSGRHRGLHFSQVAGSVASSSETSRLEIRMASQAIEDAKRSIYEYLKGLGPRHGNREVAVSTIWTASAASRHRK